MFCDVGVDTDRTGGEEEGQNGCRGDGGLGGGKNGGGRGCREGGRGGSRGDGIDTRNGGGEGKGG